MSAIAGTAKASAEGEMMRAAFPQYDVHTGETRWMRGTVGAPRGKFLPELRNAEVKVKPLARVRLSSETVGLIVGGPFRQPGETVFSFCRGCAGVLSVIPMTRKTGRWMVSGQIRDIGFDGADGRPGQISEVRLPGNTTGIISITTAWGMGSEHRWMTVWRLDEKGASASLTPRSINVSGNNNGATGKGNAAAAACSTCYNIEGSFEIDRLTGELRIRFGGHRFGPVVNALAVYRLGTLRYALRQGRNPLD